MKAHFKTPNFYLMLMADAVGIALSLWLAYALRFDFFKSIEFSAAYKAQIIPSLLAFVPLKLLIFFALGLYRGMWRYTNLRDMRKIAVAVTTASLMIISFIGYSFHFRGFSRGIYLLDAVFTFIFVAGLRIGVREFFAIYGKRQNVNPLKWGADGGPVRIVRTVVIGAGNCGEQLVRQLVAEKTVQYEVVCFLDDDPKKQRRSLHGIRIFGGVHKLTAALGKFRAELILIAISKIDGDCMRRIVEVCETTGVPFKKVPSAGSIVSGQISLKELRDVNYEDLLGRPEVRLDDQSITDCLRGKTVLVSGCGGSIGSELCRQIMAYRPGQLILLDAGEENLFNIQQQLLFDFKGATLIPVLGRVQDRPLMREVFKKYRPQAVFHAAAYKHVPMIEANPWQAVHNNILGTYVLAETAAEFKAERFVLVSTDKAVRSTNVMGASKRMAELLLHEFKDSTTRFMAVRFGNVIGSSGSVVPIFREQIRKGGPVTITHPDVTRYFMTIPEASRLIMQAGALGEGGEIFILHMGTPVKIVDMARDLIRLSGKEPDTDIKIECTGLRPGEKLYEELITEGEGIVPTRHEKIMVLRQGNGFEKGSIICQMNELVALAEAHQSESIKAKLHEFIPEYCPQQSETVV